MMSDKKYIKQLSHMSERQLFSEVMHNPEYMTDPYYRDFRRAIRKRYESLIKKVAPRSKVGE